ncbi:MAG: AraC family transcriptional regulator [Nevskiaceae bacterium]|nr:MAG: AraC family transcriptional regulator [Nevskiaceae bacterium]TBR71619.1 MAG: AraC family transcriptional regulator [Nevskiaceae bacterium]
MPDAGKFSSDAGASGLRRSDPLSLILSDIHLDGAVLRELELCAPWALRLHTPGLTAVHIVMRGRAILRREGHPPLTLEAGDIVVLPGGDAHVLKDATGALDVQPCDLLPELGYVQAEPLRAGGNGASSVLLSGHCRFDVDMARPLVTALPPLMWMHGIGGSAPPWLAHGVRFILEETARRMPGQQAIFNHVLDIILVEMLRDHVESLPEGDGGWLLALRDASLSAALAAVHGEPGRDWTVPELADAAHLSRSAFAERFTQVLGQPPLTYLTEHRMRVALYLLRHSGLSVAAVAERVGYRSDTAFSQAFKRAHGVSPSRARAALG